MSVDLCAQCLWRPAKGTEPPPRPGTGVTVNNQLLPCGCWDPNLVLCKSSWAISAASSIIFKTIRTVLSYLKDIKRILLLSNRNVHSRSAGRPTINLLREQGTCLPTSHIRNSSWGWKEQVCSIWFLKEKRMHQDERESHWDEFICRANIYKVVLCNYVFIRLDSNKWRLEAPNFYFSFRFDFS